jgi:hypothetical protein
MTFWSRGLRRLRHAGSQGRSRGHSTALIHSAMQLAPEVLPRWFPGMSLSAPQAMKTLVDYGEYRNASDKRI